MRQLPVRELPVRAVALALVFAAGCGPAAAVAPGAASAPRSEGAAQLDWALLLPIETDGLVRIDLARVRRSPHRDSLAPVVEELFADVTDPGIRDRLAAVLERTELVLVALIPTGAEDDDELLILARGAYAADELERLLAGDSTVRPIEVRGRRVWIPTDPEDATAAVQLGPDTLAITGSHEGMERLIARTGMAGGAPRWPPSLRALIEATRLEQATFGLALANRRFGPDAPEGMSMAGTVDADGPLDLNVLIELGDPALAEGVAVFFETMIRQLAQSAEGEAFALGALARRARIEAAGTRVRGSFHAGEDEARQLVPGLVGLLRDEMRGEPLEDLDVPMPSPL